jgi:PII-like signaling protein
MNIFKEEVLLRIFIGESDHFNGRALYEHIVYTARELHIGGATVIRGIMGYGANSKIHTAKILRLSEDLPIIIEIVDDEENVKKLFPLLDECVENGIVTIEKVKIIKYRSHNRT